MTATPAAGFFDAHNHLQDERFEGRQDAIVAAARDAGVRRMVVNGSCEEDWPAVLDLAARFPGFVLPSLGLHPWYVPERTPRWFEAMDRLVRESGAAIGEIGLDRWKPDLPWDGQEECFLRQMRLAADLDRPASIHCLKAWGRLVELLESGPRPERGFLLHSYGGSAELIDRLVPLGAYFSLPGYFARSGKEHKADTFRRVPPDRLLIETDAPDQRLPADRETFTLADPTGTPLQHPANLGAVYSFAAELVGEPIDVLAARVAVNFSRLFN